MGAIIALFAAGGALAGLGQYHLLRAALRDGFGKQSLTPLAGKLLLWAAMLGLPLLAGIWSTLAAALAACLTETVCALRQNLRARGEG